MENVHQWSINYILLFLICTIPILAYSLLNPPGETPNGVSQLSASQGPCILNIELLWRWLITQPYGSHHHWSPQTLSASTTTPKLIVNDFTSYLARKKKKKYIYIYTYTYTCSVTNSCLTLCDSMDCSLPGSSVHGNSQEWVTISFSRESSQIRNQTCIFCIGGRYFTAEPPGRSTHIHTYINMCVTDRVIRWKQPQQNRCSVQPHPNAIPNKLT